MFGHHCSFVPLSLLLFFIIVPALLVTGLPVAAASALSSPTSFSDPSLNRSTLEFCYFLTGTLLTSVYAVPLLLWHAEWIEQGSVLYAIGGTTVILMAATLYQVIFNKVEEDAF
jgi:VPS55-like protein